MTTETKAYETAAELLRALLAGEVDRFEAFGREQRDAYQAADKLLDTASEMKKQAERIKREVDGAVEYVSGRRGWMNSLGVLQSDGVRFDMNCALFYDRFEVARREIAHAILDGWNPYDES